MAVVASPLNLKRVTVSANDSKKRVTEARNSIKNVGQIIFRRTKVKRDAFTQTNLFRKRREENEKRQQLESELEAPRAVVTPGGPQKLAQTGVGGFFDRIFGFLGYLAAGWLMNNLPTWIAMGKEFVARIQRAGQIVSGFFNNTIKLFINVGNVLGALGQNLLRFDFFDTSNRVKDAMSGLNTTVGNLTSQIEEAFGLLTTPLTEGKYSGEKIPEVGTQQTDEGAYGENGQSMYTTAGLSGAAKERIGNDAAFLAEVKRVSQKYGIKEGDLLGLIASESGFNPAAGEIGGHVGLIQFSAASAKSVGTTQAALKRMSRAEQMKYVDKYFENWNLKKGAGSGQLYATVFAPAYASGDPNRVLYSSPSREYSSNAPLDTNRDGKITVAEMGGRIERKKKEFGISDNVLISSTTNQIPSSGKYFRPLPQGSYKGASGQRYLDPRDGGARRHLGLDITETSWKPGSDPRIPVVAIRGGVVSSRNYVGGEKYLSGLIIDQDDGYSLRYLHMSPSVRPGQKVSAGQRIGRLVNLGDQTHLHIELYAGSKLLDPTSYITTIERGGTPKSLSPAPTKPTPTPAQMSAPPQQSAMVPFSLTPERSGQDIMIIEPQQQQNIITPASGGGDMAPSPINDFDLLNNFIKNKLLLDLAYL